ncbi:hypothetical protein Q3G72_022363 [Acer saccharum]|nr:hypothetical protein Q3G72_022363 [Acer saccharum]
MVFDYFALSPFYDWTCNNEKLRMQSIHPLDISQLSKMTAIEYMLSEVMEPHLFVILDAENEGATLESKVTKETIDFKEVKRVDHILASLQRKLPPAPPPPPFPEGYTPPATTGEAENGLETQQTREPQPPPVDPIIDQVTQQADNPIVCVQPVTSWIHGYARLFITQCHSQGCTDRLQIFSTDFIDGDFVDACVGATHARIEGKA